MLAIFAIPTSGGAQSPRHDLTGLWAQRVTTTSVSRLPVIGKVENESRFYGLVRIDQDGAHLALDVEPCWVRMIGEVKRVKTIVPDEAVAVMGPQRRRGTYDGTSFRLERAVDVLGARLEDEWRDPLPKTPEDDTAFDEDRDGKPGVTIRIVGPVDGDVYVAQRTWNEMTGSVSGDGTRIRGLVKWVTEQEVLDGSSMFLRSNPASKPHPDTHRSHFEMVRVVDATSCPQIKRRNDRLFKGTP